MEETKPLLAGDTPADPSDPPSPPPYPPAVEAKNQETLASAAKEEEQNLDAESQEDVASAGKKEKRNSWVRGWIVGRRGATEARDGSSSGGINARNQDLVVDIDTPSAATTAPGGTPSPPSPTTTAPGGTRSPPPPATTAPGGTPSPPSSATTAPGGTGAEARRGFLLWVRSSLLGREGWERDDNVQTLIQRAEDFAGRCRGHCALADPAAEMTQALQNFAAAPNAATAASLGVAAASLARIAGSGKLEEHHAGVASQIASGGMALASSGLGGNCPRESRHSTCSRSPEVLFYITIPGSLGLLPYLNTTIPKSLQNLVGYLFGTAFSAATVGAVVVARARDSTDMEVASVVGAVCFLAFSLLVIVFVSFALAGGTQL